MRPFRTKEGSLETALRGELNEPVGGLGKVGQFKQPCLKERWQEKVSRQRFISGNLRGLDHMTLIDAALRMHAMRC